MAPVLHPLGEAPGLPRSLTSELQGAEGSMGLQREEIEGAVEPGGHDPERQGQLPGGLPSEPLAAGLSATGLSATGLHRPVPPAGEQ